jgi:hypothetical protein
MLWWPKAEEKPCQRGPQYNIPNLADYHVPDEIEMGESDVVETMRDCGRPY